MGYYCSVKNLGENITWYCIQLSLCFIKDTGNLRSWQKKKKKAQRMNYWLEKNNFTLRHYENNQFYKKI